MAVTSTPETPVTPAATSPIEPDVAALFAEIETILLEATLRAPVKTSVPTPIGCAVRRWSPTDRCRGVSTGAWRAPSRPIRAVQRSPPFERASAHADDI